MHGDPRPGTHDGVASGGAAKGGLTSGAMTRGAMTNGAMTNGTRTSGTDAGKTLTVERWGRTTYADAHARQEELVRRRIAGEVGDTLVLTEHEPVITLGRKTPRDAEYAGSIPLVEVERGGEATYHGPGQLVGYPIVLLEDQRRDLHRYLRDLEEVVIRVLAELGVTGGRKPGLTGVWIGERKVCSLGVAVRRWVAWHGFALNVTTDLDAFRGFKPCGLDAQVMTRVADHAGLAASAGLLEEPVVREFAAVFGYAAVRFDARPEVRSDTPPER
ncbi:MAG: lipoyl(octanoyl) transferase LipB [Planctomycetes bacterium]|nr:lipoyl(octanoyl) transferase LipB [Planctomycetota bacterium]